MKPRLIRWTEKMEKELIKKHKIMTVVNLAKLFNVNRCTIYNKLKKLEKFKRKDSDFFAFKPTLTKEEAAYIAGIIDGEGTIGYHCHFLKNGRMSGASPLLSVGNTSKELIDFLCKKLPFAKAKMYPRDSEYGRRARKDFWYINVESRNRLKFFLIEILPYLIIKKRQAEIMLELFELRGFNTLWSETDLKKVLEIKKLNSPSVQSLRSIAKIETYLNSSLFLDSSINSFGRSPSK